MAGITDKAFREIAAPFGPDFAFTEMVSSSGLFHGSEKTKNYLDVAGEKIPIIAQIFGHDPHVMQKTALEASELGIKMIDINMGCPAPKIVKNGDGAALMKNPRLAGEIVRTVAGVVNIPISVKFRRGWDEKSDNAAEFAKILEDAGAAFLTIHGRFAKQFYSDFCDLDTIKRVKVAVKIPVIGSGDVTSGESAEKMFAETGCDGVMVGRAARGNPWIFREIKHKLATGENLPRPILTEKIPIIRHHAKLLVEIFGETVGIKKFRKHFAWYLKGEKIAPDLRRRISLVSTLSEVEELIGKFL
jgi:nifR3 family TIM-barrel protein